MTILRRVPRAAPGEVRVDGADESLERGEDVPDDGGRVEDGVDPRDRVDHAGAVAQRGDERSDDVTERGGK